VIHIVTTVLWNVMISFFRSKTRVVGFYSGCRWCLHLLPGPCGGPDPAAGHGTPRWRPLQNAATPRHSHPSRLYSPRHRGWVACLGPLNCLCADLSWSQISRLDIGKGIFSRRSVLILSACVVRPKRNGSTKFIFRSFNFWILLISKLWEMVLFRGISLKECLLEF
jgi:hypothetical protein